MNLPGAVTLAAGAIAAAVLTTTAAADCPAPSAQRTADPGAPVTITYYGVSTLIFEAEGDRLVVDGFFSRPEMWLARPVSSNLDRIRAALGSDASNVRAVLTAHAHHDHALDTVALADEAEFAVVVGTPSVRRLAEAGGIAANRLCTPGDRQAMTFGGFKVTAYSVIHGPGVMFIEDWLDQPMPRRAPTRRAFWFQYLDDRNLSFLIEHGDSRFLVHPSAGPLRLGVNDPVPDVVFLGLGRVGKMREAVALDYIRTLTVGRQGWPDPAVVVPIHWDDFATPPGEPLVETPPPFDNVPKAFERLCLVARERSATRVVRLDGGAGLVWTGRGRVEVTGRRSAPCEATSG